MIVNSSKLYHNVCHGTSRFNRCSGDDVDGDSSNIKRLANRTCFLFDGGWVVTSILLRLVVVGSSLMTTEDNTVAGSGSTTPCGLLLLLVILVCSGEGGTTLVFDDRLLMLVKGAVTARSSIGLVGMRLISIIVQILCVLL
jgi:hypothetical protein